MNHLAHLALAEADDALMVGGFLGDFVKGPLAGSRPARIEEGIQLHRAIDAATNRDATMRASAERFDARLRRYAPILVDILADHLLAQRFEAYHAPSLRAFTQRAYRVLNAAHEYMPPAARSYAERLSEFDGLFAYRNTEIVERGIARVLVRLRVPELTKLAIENLHANWQGFRAEFAIYYPRLQAQVATRLAATAAPGSS